MGQQIVLPCPLNIVQGHALQDFEVQWDGDLGVPVIDELLIGFILCIHLNTLKCVERGGGVAQVVTVAQHRRPLLLLVILLLVILLSVLMLTLPLPTISSR